MKILSLKYLIASLYIKWEIFLGIDYLIESEKAFFILFEKNESEAFFLLIRNRNK